MKKLLTILLIVITLLTLCGCGGSGGTEASVSEGFSGTEVSAPAEQPQQEEAVEAENPVVSYTTGNQQIELPDGAYVNGLSCAGGNIYVSICETTESSGELYATDQNTICLLQPDGTLERIVSVNSFGVTFAALEDGSVWCYETEYGEDGMPHHELNHVSASGETLVSVSEEDLNEWIVKLLPGRDGGVVACTDYGFLIFDSAGNLAREVTVDTGFFFSGAAQLHDGSIATIYCRDIESDEREIMVLNWDTMSLEAVGKMTSTVMLNGLVGGSLDELWVDNRNLEIYDRDSQTLAKGIDWVDVGVDPGRVRNKQFLNDSTLAVLVDQGNYMACDVYVFPTGYTLKSEDKTTLTLAGVNFQDEIRQLVINFNEISTEYYVELVDYFNFDGRDPERLLYELNTGELPDMVFFSNTSQGEHSVDIMARKGYLMDLGAQMDADSDMSREDFLENVLDAVSVDGTLYTIPVIYNVESAVANPNVVGTEMGCTLEDVRGWLEQYPDRGALADVFSDNGTLLSYLLQANASSILSADGKLESETIADILEFVKYVQDRGVSGGDEMEGNYILAYAWHGDMDYTEVYMNRVGGELTFIGWPCESGFGAVIDPLREIAIASDTECPEGCWAFMKYLLTDYQEYIHSDESTIMTLPLRMDSFEAAKEKCLTVNGESEENVNKFADMILALDRAYRINSLEGGVVDIIREEAEAYFNGEKSLDAVVSSIESRANIYLAEQG